MLLAFGSLCLSSGSLSLARADDDAGKIEFFESKVRPLLAEHCYECHGAKSKTRKGNFRLDHRAGLIEGGDSGPAIVPGKPDESLLIEAVRWQSLEMPPDGKLKVKQVATLVEWIEMGAPWPDEGKASTAPNGAEDYDWDKLRAEHWAWRPIADPDLPAVRNALWPVNPIDRFVLAKLEAADLAPSAPAAAPILARRLHVDLIGLPPTPEEVDAFDRSVRDGRRDAVERLVDELLDSPRHGERWGRHWLDVARYSDGQGGFLDNAPLPQAWRYRDWIVQAFNGDLPYDRFVKLQIAGDLIGSKRDAIATGFFALGPTYHSDGGDPDSIAQAQGETLDDRMDTLGRGFMAVTVACARCHDHKFDPIPQRDYYSLAGVFHNTKVREWPLAPDEVVKAYDAHQRKIKDLDAKIRAIREKAKKAKRELADDEKREIERSNAELADVKETAPPKYPFAHALADTGNADMRIALRGNLRKPGEVAPRGFPNAFASAGAPRFTRGSGRVELADAVADRDNPLTTRVIVNRVWMHHFGQALVRSPSNFGSLGAEPTHPELLDWLATRLVESGWSLKSLHRLILTSATYRMSSRSDERAFSVDGDNELLWRMNPRRMTVESWRDSLLAVTGELETTVGGPPVEDIVNSKRRTLYAKVSRNGDRFASDEFLRLFDFPLMRATVAKRPTSIVPQQFLFLMNSPFMVERAKALSQRLHREATTDAKRIEQAYRLLFARRPTAEEARIGIRFLGSAAATDTELSPWRQYAQALLSSNEFMYVR